MRSRLLGSTRGELEGVEVAHAPGLLHDVVGVAEAVDEVREVILLGDDVLDHLLVTHRGQVGDGDRSGDRVAAERRPVHEAAER